jgi:hypothetical protein
MKAFLDLNRLILVPNIPDVSVTVSITVAGEKHDASPYRRKLKTAF